VLQCFNNSLHIAHIIGLFIALCSEILLFYVALIYGEGVW